MNNPHINRRRAIGFICLAAILCLLSVFVDVAGQAQAQGNEYALAERVCREQTADRLRVHSSKVIVSGTKDISVRGNRLEVQWRTLEGATGTCVCVGARVVSWEQTGGERSGGLATSRPPSPDSVCASAVASRVRKRPSDVDIEEVDVRHRDEALVYWVTYQGERGTCLVANGDIKRIEFE